jgi:hypothetical protein
MSRLIVSTRADRYQTDISSNDPRGSVRDVGSPPGGETIGMAEKGETCWDDPGDVGAVGLIARTGRIQSAPIERLESEGGDSMTDTMTLIDENQVNATGILSLKSGPLPNGCPERIGMAIPGGYHVLTPGRRGNA